MTGRYLTVLQVGEQYCAALIGPNSIAIEWYGVTYDTPERAAEEAHDKGVREGFTCKCKTAICPKEHR